MRNLFFFDDLKISTESKQKNNLIKYAKVFITCTFVHKNLHFRNGISRIQLRKKEKIIRPEAPPVGTLKNKIKEGYHINGPERER